MVEASKMWFDRATVGTECCDLIHPWSKNCYKASAIMLVNSIPGSYRFYAVLYLVQIILKGKKITKKYLMKQFKMYIYSGMFGFFVGTTFITFNCLLRNLVFSKFHYYTTVFLPAFLGGVGIYFEPPHRRYLVVSTFFNMVLEYWVRTLELKGLLKRTPLRETLIFMFGSSYLFYLMRQERDKAKKLSLLWFFTPPKVNREPVPTSECVAKPSDGIYCPHNGPCSDYVLKGALQMFGIGCAMTMLRTIIPRLATPLKAIKSITLKQCSLGVFLGGYLGIYRLVTCLLCQYHRKDSARHALPAGFLAGSAFWFNPNLSICLGSLTSILHILCGRMYDNKMIPEKLPLAELLYAFCQGLLFHARVMHYDVCPRYIVNLTNTVTSGKVHVVYNTFLKMLANC